MSLLVSALVPRDRRVSAADIQAQARQVGVELSFPEGLDLTDGLGVVPCLLNGQPAAFELSIDEADAPGMRAVQFEARASYASYAACAYVAACLCQLTGGQVRDDDGPPMDGPTLTAWLAGIELPEAEQAGDELRIEVSVVGPRGNGFLQLKLGRVPAGTHLARRLVETIDIDKVPAAWRAPNSRFVIVVREASEIVAVEPCPT